MAGAGVVAGDVTVAVAGVGIGGGGMKAAAAALMALGLLGHWKAMCPKFPQYKQRPSTICLAFSAGSNVRQGRPVDRSMGVVPGYRLVAACGDGAWVTGAGRVDGPGRFCRRARRLESMGWHRVQNCW